MKKTTPKKTVHAWCIIVSRANGMMMSRTAQDILSLSRGSLVRFISTDWVTGDLVSKSSANIALSAWGAEGFRARV